MQQVPSLAGQRIVVTGATGFLGRALVAALGAAGAGVVAPLRHGAGRALLPPGVAAPVLPLSDRAALTRAFAGADALAHVAHDLRAGAAENLALLDAVLGAAEAAGIGRVVFASSGVADPAWPGGVLAPVASVPEAPAAPAGYAAMKRAGEARLAAFGARTGAAALSLRPTLVHGPGSRMWTEAVLARLACGPVVLPEGAGHALPVHVADAAGAFVAALAPEAPRQGAVPVSGPAPVPWAAWYAAHARLLGRGGTVTRPLGEILARLPPAPDPAAPPAPPSAAARASALARRLLGSARVDALAARVARLRRGSGNAEVWPDRFLLDLYRARGAVDQAAVAAVLGWQPALDFPAAMAAHPGWPG